VSGSIEQQTRMRLLCRGVVQGIGARPALQRLAVSLALRGTLRNVVEGLQIDLTGQRAALEVFLQDCPAVLPGDSPPEVQGLHWLEAPKPPWPEGVRIEADQAVPLGQAWVAPGLCADRAPCARCLAELADPANRRHGYPFISCCDCGPRFTIATALPFCRAHTTLQAFPPCRACAREFSDGTDRRFHAETIGCPSCGPRLRLLDPLGRLLTGEQQALERAAELLQAGQVLALQGVGGFQLLVDGTSDRAVRRLRQRKHRPAKPFALLVADSGTPALDVVISPGEEQCLRHPAAPIVLLQRRFSHPPDAWDSVAPGSPLLGVMLPASGLHHLLVGLVNRPLVATSGNRSGEPLCLSPEEALQRLGGIADAFLVHDLPIRRPLDDSVLQQIDGRPALLRRARGFVPEPLPWRGPAPRDGPAAPKGALLALGGDLKAAPALVSGDHLWLAPHLGDLADPGVRDRWQEALTDQISGQSWAVTALACDAHPGYVSHQLLRRIATSHRLPCTAVAHHLAHGLAVAAEQDCEPPLLVLACDGLGLADSATPDSQERLWGGELLLIHGASDDGLRWQRLGALRPFPLPGGEKAAREPRRSALGLLAAAGDWALTHPGAKTVRGAFLPQERQLLLQAMAAGCNAPLTSSLGRCLDGLTSLLGLAQILTYEGEGGLRWQGASARWQAHQPDDHSASAPWTFPLRPSTAPEQDSQPLGRWDWEPLLKALLEDRAAGGSADRAAWQVERAVVEGLVEGVALAAGWTGCRQVALAGGCFQNRSLLEGCLRGLRRQGLEPLWNERVPCNDGGLALGQAWAVQAAAFGV
jgi:hydrogenase maturation protein HypF